MNCIKLLSEIVANQIAAGEVVNTPSNVVKEMMENSIDAGAQCVRVNFHNGGKELIQIIDDGVGMSPIDARLCFDRHATSKISSFEDIYSLQTFGFRGEALASIAAVAEVELRTRREEDEIGTQTLISGGEFRTQSPIACAKGTQFIVRNLFYNVPSRRKFIDGDNARLNSQIKQEFSRVALCNPNVEFELRQNDAIIYSLKRTNRAGRIVDIVGKHIKQNLLEVEVNTSVVRIEGYVGRPSAAKRRNNEQYLFVNGRYFHSPAMQRTILRAYEKLIADGSAPSYFLYFSVDAERVDVNVHPQKTTVKFADNDVILQILQAAVRETLAKTGAVPMMDFSDEGRVEIPVMRDQQTIYHEPPIGHNSSYNPFREEYIDPTAPMPDVPFTGFDAPYDGLVGGGSGSTIKESSEKYTLRPSSYVPDTMIEYIDEEESVEQGTFEYISSSINETPHFKEVVSFTNGYAIANYSARCVVVNLRRAKERVLFEHIFEMMKSRTAPSQRMFFAEELTLTTEEYELLEQHATEFAALGFDIEFMCDNRISVVGRPATIDASTPLDELIYSLLHGIDNGTLPIEEEQTRLAEIMANRATAGYGRTVSSAEAMELLQRLEQCSNPSFTPSGSPIIAEITTEELRAKLAR